MGWLNEVFPDNEQWQKFSNGVVSLTEKLKDSIEIGTLNFRNFPFDYVTNYEIPIFHALDPNLKQLGEERMKEWRLWFDSRLDNAIEAAEVEGQLEGSQNKGKRVDP